MGKKSGGSITKMLQTTGRATPYQGGKSGGKKGK